MRRTRVPKRLWVFVVAMILFTSASYLALRREAAPRQYLRGWRVPASLEMRTQGEDDVLIRPRHEFIEIADTLPGARDAVCYRLNLPTLTISAIAREHWDAPSSPIHSCDSQQDASSELVSIQSNHSVVVKGRTHDVTGHPRAARPSPTGDVVAVLSAFGARLPAWSPLPALGRGERYWGVRYHQFFSTVSGDRIGAVLALGFRRIDPLMCWEPEGRAILYTNDLFSDVSVVPVGSLGGGN